MAVLAVSDSGFQGNLKNYYTRFREDLFPLLTRLWAQIQKVKKGGPRNVRWTGKGVFFDVVSTDPVGWSYDGTGALPPSNFREEVQGSEGIKRMYVRQQFDMLVHTATQSKQGAYVSLGQKIDEEFRAKFSLGLEEGLNGDGRGIKAAVSAVTSTTVFDITSPYGITNGGQGALWVTKGMTISVYDSTLATKRATADGNITVVSSVVLQTAPDTYRVTVASAITGMQAGDVIVGASNSSSDGLNSYINGITKIVNRGGDFDVLHNIDPDDVPRWDTTRLVAGTDTTRADQLDDTALYELCMQVASKSGDNPLMNPSDYVIYTTTGAKKGYMESQASLKEGLSFKSQGTIKGGYGYDASFNGIPIIDSPYSPVGTVVLLHLPSLGWVDAKDFNDVSYGDAPVMRFVDGYDWFETSQSIFFNTLTTKRAAHGILTGLTDAKRYTPVVG